jgi:hypothetical protein
MRRIQVLITSIAIISTVLITGWAFAQSDKVHAGPLADLQHQIDQLKAQLDAIQLTPGPVDVYDNNGQCLGILLGIEVVRAEIFIPQIKWPTLINLWDGHVYPASPIARFKYESDDCSGPCHTDGDRIDGLTTSASPRSPFQYFVARSGLRSITAFSERDTTGACVVIPGGEVFKGYVVLQVLEEEIPFHFPVALPLHYGSD